MFFNLSSFSETIKFFSMWLKTATTSFPHRAAKNLLSCFWRKSQSFCESTLWSGVLKKHGREVDEPQKDDGYKKRNQ